MRDEVAQTSPRGIVELVDGVYFQANDSLQPPNTFRRQDSMQEIYLIDVARNDPTFWLNWRDDRLHAITNNFKHEPDNSVNRHGSDGVAGSKRLTARAKEQFKHESAASAGLETTHALKDCKLGIRLDHRHLL